MMHLGFWEILILFLVVLLLFGPKRLPSLGKSLAQFIKGFKGEIRGIKKEADDIKKDFL